MTTRRPACSLLLAAMLFSGCTLDHWLDARRRICSDERCSRFEQAEADDLREQFEARLARLDDLPPLLRAAALPTLARWSSEAAHAVCVPEHDDWSNQLHYASYHAIGGPPDQPIVFSRLLLAEIEAAGRVHRATRGPYVDEGYAILAFFAKVPDARLTEYRRLTGERGPAPPKGLVRRLALEHLFRDAKPDFLGSFHSDHGDRVRLLEDADELLLVDAFEERMFATSTSFPKARNAGNEHRELALRRLRMLRAALDRPFDAASFELSLRWIRRLGRYAHQLTLEGAVRPVVADVVARRGEVPLTRGHEDAASDLLLFAQRAAFDLDHEGRFPFPDEVHLPRRTVLYEHRPEVSPAPRPSELGPELSEARRAWITFLVGLRARLHESHLRDLATEEILLFRTPDENLAWLEALAARARAGGPVSVGEDDDHHLLALGALDFGDARDRAVGLALEVAALPKERFEARDRPFVSFDAFNDVAGSFALAGVRDVAEDDRLLAWARRWIDYAVEDFDVPTLMFERTPLTSSATPRVFEQLVASAVRRGDEADRRAARGVVERWIAYVRRHCTVSYGEDLYCQPYTIERFYDAARFGPALGLRAEAEALIAHVRGLAEPIPWQSPQKDKAIDLLGHAAVAAALLEAP